MTAPVEAAGDRHVSPWSRGAKLGRVLWAVASATLFHPSPQLCYRWRNWLLRRFGARIHATAHIRPSVTIEIPWNLSVGANSSVGDHAILYCLAPVTLGERVTVSQYAHLCAGTHDHTRRSMPLVPRPIILEDDVWIAADVFVGPGVTVGAGTVVGARSSVFADLPAWKVCVGTPARPTSDRVIDD
ncbi:MAG TPA: WcaF family extracellular polysaccharide biosynthesis acetyltransferase [Gemmataceae bacterium]|nr:WcaF family extracellular polysaccharide biosynthesis acetyltransferase [Gemmataceae bacterium]